MAALTTTGLLIGAGIAAGGAVGSAAIASHAAGKAADAQGEAADKALAFANQQYQQQRADTAPWRNAGGQAVNTLSGLMGLPSGPVQQPYNWGPPPGTIPNEHGPGFGILKPGVTPEDVLPGGKYGRVGAGPDGSQRTAVNGDPTGRVGVPRLADVGMAPGAAQTQSGYVLMRAPNGETQPVSPGEVDHFERLGAVRV